MKFLFFLLYLISIIAIVYAIIAAVTRRSDGAHRLPNGKSLATMGVVLLVFTIILDACIVIIKPSDVGVVETPNGIKESELYTGWHFISPLNKVHPMDRTIWVYSTIHDTEGGLEKSDAIWAACSDRIKMKFDVSTNWRINPDKADIIYVNLGGDQTVDGEYIWIEDNIIRPAIKNAVTDVASKYTSDDAYVKKRELVASDIETHLKKSLTKNNIIVESVMLREANYEPEYQTAINNTKLAEQEAKKQIEITKQLAEKELQAEKNKQIAIKYAEGEAEAIRIKANAITNNPKVLDLEWINKWNGELPYMMTGTNTSMMMQLPSAYK